jgi:vesicular inhibitory amino acid transporter
MLAYVSAGGVSASVILVGCVWWVGAVDGVGFHEDGVLLNWGGLPTTLSLFTFCYCGHAVFPTLCNSMKDRSQFSKVVTYVETGSSHIWLYDNAAMLAISFQSKFVRSVV